jgi:RNA polymerase sigma factor (TIGR02999 family)
MASANCAGTLSIDPREALAALYPELRRIARRLLTRERTHHTLQATALANEAVTRLLQKEAAGADPRTLVAYGIREMQTILIDSGRRYHTRIQAQLSPNGDYGRRSADLADLIHFQDVLGRLGELDPRACQIVELRFFAGLTIQEVAEYLGVSTRTVNDDWEFARCWLAANWDTRQQG